MDSFVFSEELARRRDVLQVSGFDVYCLFTYTGNEALLANDLNKTFEDIVAMPVMKVMHRSLDGVRFDVKELLFKGYVFLYVEKDREIANIRSHFYLFRVLDRMNDLGRLYGDDLAFAADIFRNDGVLPVSKATMEDGLVKIVSGPLKNYEGSILKYSKRNRNCLVDVRFGDNSFSVWMPFEWLEVE